VRHVTKGLSCADVEAASNEKFKIEEEQRAIRREREETGIEHKQELFHKEGEMWKFNNPLRRRNVPQ